MFQTDDFKSAATLDHIVELLSFFVDHHTYHIKNYIINKDLLRRVLVLMQSHHKFLALGKLIVLSFSKIQYFVIVFPFQLVCTPH